VRSLPAPARRSDCVGQATGDRAKTGARQGLKKSGGLKCRRAVSAAAPTLVAPLAYLVRCVLPVIEAMTGLSSGHDKGSRSVPVMHPRKRECKGRAFLTS
jgi:hypothetical protein